MESEEFAEWMERLDERGSVVVEDEGIVITDRDEGTTSPGDD
jgi:hypothetical protein